MLTVTLQIKTTNPNNGSLGNTKLSGILRAKVRRSQRLVARDAVAGAMLQRDHVAHRKLRQPTTVTVTRIAPSDGLDPHDGLGAALKGIIDGIADALGFENDRDPRLTWVLQQRRGAPRYYAVEVQIERRAEEKTG